VSLLEERDGYLAELHDQTDRPLTEEDASELDDVRMVDLLWRCEQERRRRRAGRAGTFMIAISRCSLRR
jgi:hypothetical protein